MSKPGSPFQVLSASKANILVVICLNKYLTTVSHSSREKEGVILVLSNPNKSSLFLESSAALGEYHFTERHSKHFSS